MRFGFLVILLAGVVTVTASAHAAEADWTALDWLVGRWDGEGGGAQQGTGGFSFLPDVNRNVLVRRNVADYPAQSGRPAQHHEDLMVVFSEAGRLRATYWDSEGQTIHYDVETAPDSVVFLSEPAPGPRFRLTYRRTSPGLAGQFEIAPPDDPARFKSYLTWTAHRTAAR